MFRRRARRIAELEQVVARVGKRLDEVEELVAGIGGFEHEKVRQQVEELRAESERILRDRSAEKLRHENDLARRKTAHAITLAHARAAVQAELDDLRRRIAEARQGLPPEERGEELARPESLRPIGTDEVFAPMPREEDLAAELPPPRGGGREARGADVREDQAAP